MNKRKTFTNVLSVFLLQATNIVSNFVIPKLILQSFGSEANGLVSSLNQFLNYIAIIEGGINGVIMASLYRPLVERDNKKISSIVKTSNSFFKKISLVLIIYTIVLAVFYPLLFKTSYNWTFVFTLTIVLSIKLFIQYCFSFTLRNLLNADKRVYLVSLTQIGLIVLDTISAVIVIKLFPDLHLLKLISAAIFVAQPIIYGRYVKKHYNIEKNVAVDKELLKSRWDGLAINTAAFVHGNTDIAIISIFRGLKEASVYSVYALVTTGLKTLCQSLWKALVPSVGKLYASGDIKTLNRRFDIFEYLTFFMTFFMFSVAGLLITPFVQLYTTGITDANYCQPLFGAIILIAEGVYILREPYVNLAYSANKFKDLRKHAIIEAVLNIVISLALVSWLGLIGIAIGTLVAMSYRTIFQILYLRKHLINRPFRKFLRSFLAFAIPTAALILLCIFALPLNNPTISGWISYAIIYSVIFIAVYAVISVIFFRTELRELKAYIKHK